MNIKEVAQLYIDMKDRVKHPEGNFDNGGRFYLAKKFDCCSGIRTPSRAFPYSELVHGRTLKHLAHQYELDERELRKAVKALNSNSN